MKTPDGIFAVALSLITLATVAVVLTKPNTIGLSNSVFSGFAGAIKAASAG